MEDTFELIQPTFNIADFIEVPKPKESKFSFEFQELCSEMEPLIGKACWSLPFKAGFTESKIRRAFAIAKDRNILTLPYIIGIVKRDRGL